MSDDIKVNRKGKEKNQRKDKKNSCMDKRE